jgi:hypothetical protein
MPIAGHEIVAVPQVGAQMILAIFGGPGKVDAIHIDPKHGSPAVTVEIKIVSEPPLRVPFLQRYRVQIPPDYQSAAELNEVKL